MGDGLVEAAVQHVGGSHRGAQPRPLATGAVHPFQAVQRRLQRAQADIETSTEQVSDRDHARHQPGRRAHVTGRGGQVMGCLVCLGSGRVVVGGRGLVAERGEQSGPIQRWKLGRQVPHRPAVQLERLAVG